MSYNMGTQGHSAITWDPGVGQASACKQEHSLAKAVSIFMFSGRWCSGQTLLIFIGINNATELIITIVAEMLQLLVWLIQIYFAPI